MKTHGKSKSIEYMTWNRMLTRCYNPLVEKYKRYGARGIKVCDEWKLFVNFYKDMGDRPDEFHSLGRIDNDGNYCKENCRWETNKTQSNNTSRNVFIEFNGCKKTISEWAEITGITYATIIQRFRLGLSADEVLKDNNRKVKSFTIDGISKKTTEWMRDAQIPISSYYHFKRKGISEIDIIKSYLLKN